jgi:UDP-glucose 4-epimerase
MSISSQQVLVTGGAGFIGSHIVEALLAAGAKVRVLDDLSTGHRENLAAVADRVDWIGGSVTDPEACLRAAEGCSRVVHEAALVSVPRSIGEPRLNHDINLTGTFNILEACRAHGVKRLVFASTAAVYGNQPGEQKREQDPWSPESPYAASKLAAEMYMRVYARCHGLEAVALRYFNVYGPRQDPASMYAGVISKFVDLLGAGKAPVLHGDGGQTRDFVYVKDVARANVLALGAKLTAPFQVFNVGTGRARSLLDLLSILGDITGQKPAPRFEAERAGDIRHSCANVGAVREAIGFTAGYTLESGLGQWLGSGA